MSEKGAATIAMRGAGYYSSNTVGAKAVIDKLADRVVEAIARMPEIAAGPFALADFGAADGGTSIDLMRRAVEAIRAREPGRQITITYTDLPHNDFSALFRLTQGLLGPRTQAPLAGVPGLYIFGSGTSFYRQIFPDGALSLGFSATAMHWLSARPCMISGSRPGRRRRARRARTIARPEPERLGDDPAASRARIARGRPAGVRQFLRRRSRPLSGRHARRQHVRRVRAPLARAARDRADHGNRICRCDLPAVLQDPGKNSPRRSATRLPPSPRRDCGWSIFRPS